MYSTHELTDKIKKDVKAQWNKISEDLNNKSMQAVAEDDTLKALDNGRFTYAVRNEESNEYVALIGLIKAEVIHCHKVLDIKLNPRSNPDYTDEQGIGMMSAAEDIVGSIVALTEKGIMNDGMKQLKILGRGHDMKTFFKLVGESVLKNPIDSLTVTFQSGWLVIERI